MKFLLSLLIGVCVLSGCTVNHAKLTHGMKFAMIEDSAQNAFRLGMSKSEVDHIASEQWGLKRRTSDQPDRLGLEYVLEPKSYSKLAPAVHQSFLKFQFDADELESLEYTNYWLSDSLHGKNDIHLVENYP